jgi:hypothetical protein
MEPLLIDKLINRIEARGCYTSKRELARLRKELDKIVCENIHLTFAYARDAADCPNPTI